jgi:flotillin
MMLQMMPKIAAEVSGPISQTNKITMVAAGDGPVGASRITQEVLDIMGSLPDIVEKMTGVNITEKLARTANRR